MRLEDVTGMHYSLCALNKEFRLMSHTFYEFVIYNALESFLGKVVQIHDSIKYSNFTDKFKFLPFLFSFLLIEASN